MHGKSEEAIERSGTDSDATGLFVDGIRGAKTSGIRGASASTITRAEFQTLLNGAAKKFTAQKGHAPSPAECAKIAGHLKKKLASKGITGITG